MRQPAPRQISRTAILAAVFGHSTERVLGLKIDFQRPGSKPSSAGVVGGRSATPLALSCRCIGQLQCRKFCHSPQWGFCLEPQLCGKEGRVQSMEKLVLETWSHTLR